VPWFDDKTLDYRICVGQTAALLWGLFYDLSDRVVPG